MKSFRSVCWLALVSVALLSPSVLWAQGAKSPIIPTPPKVVPPKCVPGYVFVADGAGEQFALSENLRRIFDEKCLPYRLVTVAWSNDLGLKADYKDYCNHKVAGARLAKQVLATRKACPGSKVVLVGYSTGCAVILAAADVLPPAAVERIILLAPAVSNIYDLRPALRSARLGIDRFYSEEDGVLERVEHRLGTTDYTQGPTAGRVGFRCISAAVPDAQLYKNLRQHRWTMEVADHAFHQGGHFGYTRLSYLKKYIVPLFFASEVVTVPLPNPKKS